LFRVEQVIAQHTSDPGLLVGISPTGCGDKSAGQPHQTHANLRRSGDGKVLERIGLQIEDCQMQALHLARVAGK
jgi:hypothetical protein